MDEYAFFVTFGKSAPKKIRLQKEWVSGKGRTHTGKIRWDLLRRSGTRTRRTDSPGCFYPLYIDPETTQIKKVGAPLTEGTSNAPNEDGLIALLPIRKNGTEGNWQWGPKLFRERLIEGRVKVGGNASRGFTIYILKPGEYEKIQKGEYLVVGTGPNGDLEVEPADNGDEGMVTALPSTQWRIKSHDATQYGSRLLANFIPHSDFSFPKSLYAVEDSLRFFIEDKPQAVVLDFFAGSGTTAHAVMRINHRDGGLRQCICVTNNEVGPDEQRKLKKEKKRPGDEDWEKQGISEYITKPRVKAAITGNTPNGDPVSGDYKFTDEFPMADGFDESAEFFTLTYEIPISISHNRAFNRIAPLLWMRAGSRGRRIEVISDKGWDVAETYGVLFDLDHTAAFCKAVKKVADLRIAYIVTNDDKRFQSVSRHLPDPVEPVRLYESYLSNFQFTSGE
jgi:adenine-specific DNA-methyltransferase